MDRMEFVAVAGGGKLRSLTNLGAATIYPTGRFLRRSLCLRRPTSLRNRLRHVLASSERRVRGISDGGIRFVGVHSMAMEMKGRALTRDRLQPMVWRLTRSVSIYGENTTKTI